MNGGDLDRALAEWDAKYAAYLASKDSATVAVYEAEGWFTEGLSWICDELPDVAVEALTAPQAQAEAGEVLRRASYEDPDVVVVLDIGDDEMRAASYDPMTGAIHGPRSGIRRDALLHELGHWMRPHDRHGSQFRASHATAVAIVLGVDTGDELVAAYADAGLHIDESWYTPPAARWCDLMWGDLWWQQPGGVRS